ncbi:MAG: hypothetical protein GEV08_03465 [Acidimicrobiia bacterium]|nr:hypothetical protein [Acidimicrobiia bacterium]
MSRRRASVFLAIALSLVGGACGSSDSGVGGEAGQGGTLDTKVTERLEVSDAPEGVPTTIGPRGEPEGRFVYAWHTAFSPAWLDPSENPALITVYAFQYALHDALVKHLPGQPFAPSLAESYDIADDFRMATFTLREDARFHNGEPVTSADAKFSFENYRGANATLMKSKVERIETPDPRTIRFVFNEPFLDFLLLYGSAASGAGWVVPQEYYTEVGPDGFKQHPIGAGPYKFVRNDNNTEIELEAVPDYWRRSPNVKTLVYRFITDAATRFAAVQTGEVDAINQLDGALIPAAMGNSEFTVAATQAGPFWLEFPGWEQPGNPFNDIRVRKAISLAIDRQALSDAEAGGMAPIEGTWIPETWPGAITKDGVDPETYESNLDKAKQLMAEAGVPDGFEVPLFTPLPPYYSLAERLITQLGEIGIRTTLNKMERAAFVEALASGPDALPGIILNISGAPGDAASRIRAFATCEGASSRTCIPEVDQKFAAYEASTDAEERDRLITEVQRTLSDQYVFPYVYELAFVTVQGQTLANPWDEIWGAIPQYLYLGPYEDIELRS